MLAIESFFPCTGEEPATQNQRNRHGGRKMAAKQISLSKMAVWIEGGSL